MNSAAAEAIAIAALAHIAQDVEMISRFSALTGIDPTGLRAAAETPGFLAGVLDFLCTDEPLLLAFAANAGIDPTDVDTARQTLAGPDGGWSA